MDYRKIFLGIVLVVIALGARAAEFSGNFSPTADCFVPTEESYSLRNNTLAQHTYTIRAVGEHREWINLDGKWVFQQPLQVSLAPGQSKELFAFLKPQDCYGEPGTYPITLEITNDEKKSRIIQLKVVPIRTIQLQAKTSNVEITQCQKAVYDFSISNTGKSDELVELRVSGIPAEWASFSSTQFLLEKGKTRQMQFTVSPACTAETKTHTFSLKAFLAGTGFFTKTSMGIAIKDVQLLALARPVLAACNDSETSAELLLENKGMLADKIQLRIEGPDWIQLQKKDVSIAAKKNERIVLQFNKTNATAREYHFKLVAHSTLFNKATEFPLNVTLSDCYGAIIGKTTIGNADYKPGEEACLEETIAIETSITNNREKPLNLKLSVEGANSTVEPSTLSLAAGEAKKAVVKPLLANENPGNKDFRLLVKSDQFEAVQDFSLKLVDCYNLAVDYGQLLKPVDINAEEEKAFTVTLKNLGIKTIQAEAMVSGTKWVYFQPNKRTIEPGKQEGVFLYMSPPFDSREGTYNAAISINALDFNETKSVSIKVYGGLYALVGRVKLDTNTTLTGVSEVAEKTVEVKIVLKNDGNALLRLNNVKATGYNATLDFKPVTLEPGQETGFSMKIFLGNDFNERQFVVPLRVSTDKGDLVKSIAVDLSKPVAPQAIGLFALGGTKDLLIIVLALIVIVLITIIALGASGKEGKETASGETLIDKQTEKNIRETRKKKK